MMIATCIDCASEKDRSDMRSVCEVGPAGERAKGVHYSTLQSVASHLDDAFHVSEVTLQRSPAGGRKAVRREGATPLERLGARHVAGVLELARVDAEISIRGAQQRFELAERQRFIGRKCAHHAESEAMVNERVELARAFGGVAPGSSIEGPRRGRLGAAARRGAGPSHRN